VDAVFELKVTVLLADKVVKAPVDGSIVPILEFVIVLLLIVSELVSVASVPVVGSVTEVFPVAVMVVVNAPEKVKLPPIVIVLEPLFTPVPP
jgi:hypothetical protein